MRRVKIVLLSTLIAFLLSGCGIIDIGGLKGDGNYNNSKKETEIIIYNDDNPITFTVRYGVQAEITALTKSNHYLKGYFTERSDGEKYFDVNGKSTAVWQEGNPDIFYAQWGSLEDLLFTETNDGVFGGPTNALGSNVTFYYNLVGDFGNAIRGNLDKELKIVVKFKMKVRVKNTDKMQLITMDRNDSAREIYDRQDITELNFSNYDEYEIEFTSKAEVAKNGRIYLVFNRVGGVDYSISNTPPYHIKDFSIKITF